MKINLVAESFDDRKKMAKKLHAQFGHPPAKKLKNVVKRAGLGKDKKLLKEIGEVSNSCRVCKEFTRPSPTPVVSLPHAEHFNEMVALDLKFFEGKIILHAIDHLTRYSAGIIIRNKEADTIIKGIVKCWIATLVHQRNLWWTTAASLPIASLLSWLNL